MAREWRVGVRLLAGVCVVAVLSLLGAVELTACSPPAPPAESVYYTLTGSAAEADTVSNTNGSGGRDNPGTVTIPYTSPTYPIKPQGASGYYAYSFSVSGEFYGSSGAYTGTVTVYANGTVETEQSYSGNDNLVPFYVGASWQK